MINCMVYIYFTTTTTDSTQFEVQIQLKMLPFSPQSESLCEVASGTNREWVGV